ncbi:MAG: DNA-directed RNA polymerase subunit L [archaeon]|jgi:DNA-directed RNA polymerase subunit L|nr:DNA-directed RNA polymerase subunit L [Euryarchaeota archaeon]MDP7260465.1 DNA-directed RNA polymerase subunit L [archaeon]HIK01223.1 DNA-directed RNA polymerase subunit L [Candidatus Undinarchaeales archaeon ERR594346 U_76725]|tara:strand:+ start:45634 stop:45906 length:273 start_codon:yes stop_codon:yes gene_type:complete
MELNIIKEEKDMLQVELVGETHTLANILKEELYEDPKVKGAAYVKEDSLTSNPRIVIRTSGKKPMTALKDAAKRIQKQTDDFVSKFERAN